MTQDNDPDMTLIYEDVAEFIQKASYQYDPMQIATCMLAQSLSLSKAVLAEEDFKKFCDYVLRNTHKVKPFDIN